MGYFVLFVLLIYLPGFCFSIFFREFFSSYYKVTEYNYFLFLFVLSIFLFSFCILSLLLICLPAVKSYSFKKVGGYVFFDLLSIVFFLLSLYFFVSYSSDFRHKSRLADASALVSVLWMLRPLVLIVLLSYIIHVCNGGIVSNRSKIVLLLIIFGLILSLTSSLQVIVIFVASLLLFSPKYFRYNLIEIGVYKIIIALIVVPILGVTVIAFGLAGKIGYEKVFSTDILNVLLMSVGSIVPRISSSFMSALTVINDLSYYKINSYDFFENAYLTFDNRLNILLGNSYNADGIYTLNRFNQLHVFQSNPDRAGASPGVIASIFYFPLFPLGYFYMTFYFSSLFVLMARKFKDNSKVGALAGVTIPVLTIYFLESPLNVFYIIDPFFFTLVFYMFFFKCIDFEYALNR